MRTWTVSLIVAVALTASMTGQSNPSIQGVWRALEVTVPSSEEGRRDPFGAFSGGTQANLQPQLMIFTARHYSRTTDTAAQPRPTTEYKTPGKPTLEELQAEWGPFVANAGTYEVSGNVLTLRAIVAKNPRAQTKGNFTRLEIKLEGNNLWLTPLDTETGKINRPVTSKYVRVE